MNIGNALKQFILLIIILILMPVFAHENTHQTLVLVTSINNPIETLPNSIVRKLFLNVPVSSNKQLLIPIINTGDKLLFEIFLQKIAYMSERNYERLLISKTFRSGRPRPERHSDNTELIAALKSTTGSVSVMWKSTANNESDIRIIQTLWEDRH